MKILFITRKFPPAIGGMETFSAALAHEFGSDMDVLALRRHSQFHLVWWLPLTLCRAVWRGRSYDVVHFGDGVLAIMGVLLRRWCQRPVTITLHGLDITYHRFLYQRYIWWALRQYDRLICVSETTARVVRAHGIDATRVVVIPNGITVQDWPVRNANTPPKLLTVGRLVPRKGIAWFVDEVMPHLSPPTTYHIVGTGQEESAIRTVIAKHQLEERVIMHGRVDDLTLKKLYRQSSAFIMPNVEWPNDMEGFGIVILEAGAVGVPVIASRLEGLTDAVIDGVTGFLVESRRVSAWQATIERVLREPHFIPEQIRAAVHTHFHWSAIAVTYRTEFNRLISHHHGESTTI